MPGKRSQWRRVDLTQVRLRNDQRPGPHRLGLRFQARNRPAGLVVPGHVQQQATGDDDAVVAGHQVLLRAVGNAALAFLHRRVLHGKAGDAGEVVAPALCRPVQVIVVVPVGGRSGGCRVSEFHVAGQHRGAMASRSVSPERLVDVVIHRPRPAVAVVQRHPGLGVQGQVAGGRDDVEAGHQELRDAPVIKPLAGHPPRARKR